MPKTNWRQLKRIFCAIDDDLRQRKWSHTHTHTTLTHTSTKREAKCRPKANEEQKQQAGALRKPTTTKCKLHCACTCTNTHTHRQPQHTQILQLRRIAVVFGRFCSPAKWKNSSKKYLKIYLNFKNYSKGYSKIFTKLGNFNKFQFFPPAFLLFLASFIYNIKMRVMPTTVECTRPLPSMASPLTDNDNKQIIRFFQYVFVLKASSPAASFTLMPQSMLLKQFSIFESKNQLFFSIFLAVRFKAVWMSLNFNTYWIRVDILLSWQYLHLWIHLQICNTLNSIFLSWQSCIVHILYAYSDIIYLVLTHSPTAFPFDLEWSI